ncbi:MAG: GNAT family N-acetyltransferase [Acidobacteriota bacterium]|nr:GNAT family N-acetyltransferase [Acidobacteriota bacterium]
MARVASAADGPEVVRLAEAMFRPLGGGGLDEAHWARWREASLAVTARLPSDGLGVFVVDHPERPGALAACGAGVVVPRLPNPWHPNGLAGYVQWMSTEPDWRRRGFGRAVLRAVLRFFEERGVDNVELHATASGAPLYRSEGFWEGSSGLAMRRRPWDPPPERR